MTSKRYIVRRLITKKESSERMPNYKIELPTIEVIAEMIKTKNPEIVAGDTFDMFSQILTSFKVERVTEDIFKLTAPNMVKGEQVGLIVKMFDITTSEVTDI